MDEYPVGGRERRRQAALKCESSGKDLYYYGYSHVPCFFESDSAVEGEAQDKAQAFRIERNGPVPLSTVAGIGAMSGILPGANEVPSNKKTLKHYGSTRSLLQAHASPSTSYTIEVRN